MLWYVERSIGVGEIVDVDPRGLSSPSMRLEDETRCFN